MSAISVNPDQRQLRSAFARIISSYALGKGLGTVDATRRARKATRAKAISKKDALPEPDLVWMDRGRAIWKFHILPGPRAMRRLGVFSKVPTQAVICVDSAGNIGFIEPAGLLDFLERQSSSADIETIRTLAKDIVSTPKAPRDFHFTGVVTKNHHFLKDHFSLRVRTGPLGKPAPGQFLQILCDPAPHTESQRYKVHSTRAGKWPKLSGMELTSKRPFLRRPFSLASCGPPSPRDELKDVRLFGTEWLGLIDWAELELEIIYRRAPGGPGTGALAAYRAGDEIDIVGPLGKGFNISPAPEVALLVGGGIGATPMLFLAEELARCGVAVEMFVGAVTRARIPFQMRRGPKPRIPRFERWGIHPVICTDDGSAGLRSLVTEPLARYLEKNKKSAPATKIFACGPRPMLAALEGIATRFDAPCEVLLEERMACGFGACISCVCGVKETGQAARYTRICTEGPAFDVRKVMWRA